MANTSTPGSIDEYVATFALETQQLLQELRALVREAAPGATEKISYGMPAFELDGRYLVYFAAYSKHVGFYPVTDLMVQAFGAELEPYKSGEGTLRFPLGQPVPSDLIRRIVKFRTAERSTT